MWKIYLYFPNAFDQKTWQDADFGKEIHHTNT